MKLFTTPRVYLDYAAAAPVTPAAARAFADALALYGNPSSAHTEGREAREHLESARVRIARLAQVKSDAVIFTSGATEANALGIEGYVRNLSDDGRSPSSLHVLYLSSSHASTQGAVERLSREGVQIETIALNGTRIDLAALAKQIRPETVLVCLDVVCSETGVRFDTRGVRQVLLVARKNAATKGRPADAGNDTSARIMIHADASQLPRVESFELMRVDADMLTLDAQKVGGVRGIGALIVPSHIKLSPHTKGGGQERGLRPGTESPALAVAFAVALEECAKEREVFTARALRARKLLLSRFTAVANLFITEGRDQAPHIVNVSLPGRDTDYALALLDEDGFAVSTRSACETDASGSRAVLAFTGDEIKAASTIRVSWGAETSEKDFARFAESFIRTITFLDASS